VQKKSKEGTKTTGDSVSYISSLIDSGLDGMFLPERSSDEE
jgi:hypothetical protein